MITIRRLRCAAAAMGVLAGASVMLALPQRVPAQASAAGDAAGTAVHTDIAEAARSGRKPAALTLPTVMAFKPATIKPLPAAAGEDVAEREPAAEQAAKPSGPPETIPAPAVAEPAPPGEAVVARLPDRTAEDAASGDATEKEAKAGDQQAALPPASDPARPPAIATLVFASESATLSTEAKGMLKDLATRFPAHDEGSHLQLVAYAGGEGMSASRARRLSLARALSVREYLIANGIDGTRMDVRALGDPAAKSPSGSPAGSPDDSPANRVDIAMIRR